MADRRLVAAVLLIALCMIQVDINILKCAIMLNSNRGHGADNISNHVVMFLCLLTLTLE